MATGRSTAVARRTTSGQDRTKTGPTPRRPRQPVTKGETITHLGEEYRLADKIGVWPLMQLARAAQEGVASTDMRGLAALHAMFEDIIDAEDFPRFEAHMIASKMTDPMALLETTQEAVVRIQTRQARANGQVVAGEIAS